MAFRNIVVCDDIRDEMNLKKSLMGIFGGDIRVAEFPARINLAFYIEYAPEGHPTDKIQIRIMQNNEEMGKADIAIPPKTERIVVMALPRALLTFEKETNLRLLAKVGDQQEQEITTKRIYKDSSLTPPLR